MNNTEALPLDKASYLLDMLEIDRRRYTEARRLFLTENIHHPLESLIDFDVKLAWQITEARQLEIREIFTSLLMSKSCFLIEKCSKY